MTHFWQVPKSGTRTIQIDIDPAEIGRNYPAAVCLLGDARVTLQRLTDALEPQEPNASWVGRVQELVQRWRNEFEPLLTSSATPIRPERLCREITNILPSDAVVAVRTNKHAFTSVRKVSSSLDVPVSPIRLLQT